MDFKNCMKQTRKQRKDIHLWQGLTMASKECIWFVTKWYHGYGHQLYGNFTKAVFLHCLQMLQSTVKFFIGIKKVKNPAKLRIFLMKIIICYEIVMYAKYGHSVATPLQVAGLVTVLQSRGERGTLDRFLNFWP